MFSKKIIDSDSFLDMPLSTQALYFHLVMWADDDGFLNNARKIMKIVGAAQADYDRLIDDRFILQFNDGICVIKHWRIHNYLRADRYKKTQYLEEKAKLYLKENGAYTLNKDKAVSSLSTSGELSDTQMATVGIPDENQLTPNGNTNDNQMDTWLTQDRIGKERIGKESIKKYICPEPGKPAPGCSDIFLPLVDGTFYNVPYDKIENWLKAFPAVDVDHELRKMLTWLDSNPKNQKTSRGVNRFINGWLSRTQDRGGSAGAGQDRVIKTTRDGRILQ